MQNLQEDHPRFDQALGADVSREHRLHQLVAASAFVLALSILPVAQYFLGSTAVSGEVAGVSTGSPASTYGAAVSQSVSTSVNDESGEVAGVSTDERVLASDDLELTNTSDLILPADPAECEVVREQRINDLRSWSEGYKKSKQTSFDAKVKPYRDAISVITGTPEFVVRERAALEAIIGDEYKPYLQTLATVEAAVSDKQQALERAICGAE